MIGYVLCNYVYDEGMYRKSCDFLYMSTLSTYAYKWRGGGMDIKYGIRTISGIATGAQQLKYIFL